MLTPHSSGTIIKYLNNGVLVMLRNRIALNFQVLALAMLLVGGFAPKVMADDAVLAPVQQVLVNLSNLYNSRQPQKISNYLDYVLDERVTVVIKSTLVDFKDMTKVLDVQNVTLGKNDYINYQSNLNSGYSSYSYSSLVASAGSYADSSYLVVLNVNEQGVNNNFNSSGASQYVYISSTCNLVFRNPSVDPRITGINCYEKIAKVINNS